VGDIFLLLLHVARDAVVVIIGTAVDNSKPTGSCGGAFRIRSESRSNWARKVVVRSTVRTILAMAKCMPVDRMTVRSRYRIYFVRQRRIGGGHGGGGGGGGGGGFDDVQVTTAGIVVAEAV